MAPGAYVLRLRPSLTQMFREVGVGTISEVLDLRLCCLGKPTSLYAFTPSPLAGFVGLGVISSNVGVLG
jgi:hypothetical protein